MKKYRYLFGPVPSRRFGRSLGVDLVNLKTCCFDCIFCHLGRTSCRTEERREYVPTDSIITEIEDWFSTDNVADYITLAGSGEPTLNSGFGKVLKFLKNKPIPSVLLTNGAMLHLPEVRDAASCADIVKVSLSAWDQNSLEWVNRPDKKLHFDKIVKGLKTFRAQYNGMLWMEVFLVFGINSMPESVKKIAALIKDIYPDRIHLNTVVRPPVEDFAAAISEDHMNDLASLFEPTAEVIAEFKISHTERMHANEEIILSMLRRRPCTIHQVADVFGMHINEVAKYLGKLIKDNLIYSVHENTNIFYSAVVGEDHLIHVKKTS